MLSPELFESMLDVRVKMVQNCQLITVWLSETYRYVWNHEQG